MCADSFVFLSTSYFFFFCECHSVVGVVIHLFLFLFAIKFVIPSSHVCHSALITAYAHKFDCSFICNYTRNSSTTKIIVSPSVGGQCKDPFCANLFSYSCIRIVCAVQAKYNYKLTSVRCFVRFCFF